MEEESLKRNFLNEVENFADEFERSVLDNLELKKFIINYIDLFIEPIYGLISYETFKNVFLALTIKNTKIQKDKLINKAFEKAKEFAKKGYEGNFLFVVWKTAEVLVLAKILNVLE